MTHRRRNAASGKALMTTETSQRNSLPSQQSSRWIVVAVVAASVVLHGVAYGSLRSLRKPARQAAPADEAVYAPKPRKRYVVKVAPPPRRPAVAKARTPTRRLERLERRPQTRRAPPRRARAPRRAVKQAARTPRTLDLTQLPRAGVNATLTSQGGTVAFAVGDTAQGDPDAPAGKRPRKKRGTPAPQAGPAPAPAPAVAPPAPVTIKQLPRVLRVPRVAYPKRARDKRIQGTVKLRVTVGANGRVLRVKVLRGLGYGLDRAAVRALRRARFEPAKASNGRSVPYTIRYRYRFRLED